MTDNLPLSRHSPPPQILKELHASCAPTDDGTDVDSTKGTLQLEVYALEIQMYGEMKNNKKLRVRSPSPVAETKSGCLWLTWLDFH